MNTSEKRYTIKHIDDYPAYFDFTPKTERRGDGTTVKVEYTKLLDGEVLESEVIVDETTEAPATPQKISVPDVKPERVPPKPVVSEAKLSKPPTIPTIPEVKPTKTPAKPAASSKKSARAPKRKAGVWSIIKPVLASLTIVTLAFLFSCTVVYLIRQHQNPKPPLTADDNVITGEPTDEGDVITVDAIAEETEEYEIEFTPHCVESTKPENYVLSSDVNADGENLNGRNYQPPEEISFGLGGNYFQGEGVITFRGNNFRSDPTYGHAEMTQHQLNAVWSVSTGSLAHGDAVWTGSGWTGQPLIRKWSREQKQHMNMYDWAKEDDDLVEVIYACMDGVIYFLDLKTGQQTRDTMNLGFTFKGSGALDPRGYPILYVGAGYDGIDGRARVFIVNLFDCSVMYTFGNNDPFSLRGELSYFDSSALVDAETDTLIYPGENGVLYLIKLGTQYNEDTGSLSINPSHVTKWHCNSTRTRHEAYWPGMEDSAVIYKGFLYIMDNGGNFYCLNLNTLELVWVQDCLDDSNGSPVLSIEDGKAYLYASTSFHLGWRSRDKATIPIWKIDAETGEIVWQVDYECQSMEDLSGGVQSTIAVGKNSLKDYIYVTVSRTGGMYNGVLACIEKKSGNRKWEHESAYTWSSPVCVYNSQGEGNIIYCTSAGKMYLLNGLTGDVYDEAILSDGNIEASPAVYDDYAIVGIRACKIWGVQLQ